jgi:hypothetical protein
MRRGRSHFGSAALTDGEQKSLRRWYGDRKRVFFVALFLAPNSLGNEVAMIVMIISA